MFGGRRYDDDFYYLILSAIDKDSRPKTILEILELIKGLSENKLHWVLDRIKGEEGLLDIQEKKYSLSEIGKQRLISLRKKKKKEKTDRLIAILTLIAAVIGILVTIIISSSH